MEKKKKKLCHSTRKHITHQISFKVSRPSLSSLGSRVNGFTFFMLSHIIIISHLGISTAKIKSFFFKFLSGSSLSLFEKKKKKKSHSLLSFLLFWGFYFPFLNLGLPSVLDQCGLTCLEVKIDKILFGPFYSLKEKLACFF